MEMSVGTMVTIVLLMVVLVLGIFFIQKIFKTGTTALDQIDQSVKDEINQIFGQDETKKIVILPSTRTITMNQGDSGGFGFSIRNTENTDGAFSYEVSVLEVGSNCQMTEEEADELIILGKESLSDLDLPSGQKLENPILVKFEIPESAPLCTLRYVVNVEKDGVTYIPGGVSVDLKIK